jgi:hypothetical protein
MANVASIRAAFHMSMLNPNQVAKDSHDVYRLNMLSGSLKYLDNSTSNGSSSTLSSISNMIVWGDDGGKTAMNGTTTSGAATITGLASTARFSVGQSVSGTGIASNSYIKSIDSATQFTMTRNATASATVTVTGSSKGIEADVISAGNLFLSLYNTRVRSLCCQAVNRSSYAIYNTVELVYARGCRFERTIGVNRWSNITDSVIAQGILWQNNTQNGENDGIYNCDLQTAGALFEGPASALLKMDGASNYYFQTNGCVLGSNTTKLVLDRPGTSFIQAIADKTVANSGAETSLIGASPVGSATIPVNNFGKAKTYRVKALGYISSDAAAGTLNIKLKAGSTVLGETTAITLENSLSQVLWTVEFIMTCRTSGTSGTVIGQGSFMHNKAASADVSRYAMKNTAAVTIDTTATQALDLTATWGTADADNTITCTNFFIEDLSQ